MVPARFGGDRERETHGDGRVLHKRCVLGVVRMILLLVQYSGETNLGRLRLESWFWMVPGGPRPGVEYGRRSEGGEVGVVGGGPDLDLRWLRDPET